MYPKIFGSFLMNAQWTSTSTEGRNMRCDMHEVKPLAYNCGEFEFITFFAEFLKWVLVGSVGSIFLVFVEWIVVRNKHIASWFTRFVGLALRTNPHQAHVPRKGHSVLTCCLYMYVFGMDSKKHITCTCITLKNRQNTESNIQLIFGIRYIFSRARTRRIINNWIFIISNQATNGPHIVHLSTMCHLFDRSAIFLYWSAEKNKLGRGRWDHAVCQLSLNSVQRFQRRSRKYLRQSKTEADILFFWSAQKHKLCRGRWDLASHQFSLNSTRRFQKRSRHCPSQSKTRAVIFFFDWSDQHKLCKGRWDLASCQVSLNSVHRFQRRSRKFLSQSEDRVATLFFWSARKTQTLYRTLRYCPCQVSLNSIQRFQRCRKCISQPGARAAILFFLIGPKNTNLVGDVEILLPVKFRWISFSGFRGETEHVKS